MTRVKSKHIFLIFIVSVVGVLAYSCIKFSMKFRFPGDRGAAYETFETANNTFKVKITALDEEGIYMPGAYFVCESAPIDSNKWREFIAFRIDDANYIPREQFRFVNEQTAYVYMSYDFVVTVDGGQTWKVWKPLFPQSNGELLYWVITEARVEADGTGRAKVENYDEQRKARVVLEIRTEDFGQNWRVVKL
jgi:hypothetical protein